MKKIVLFFLGWMFLFLPFVTAEGYYDITQRDLDEISNVMITELIQGDEYGYFNPNKELTRAEVAVILTRVIGRASGSILYKADNVYKDVPEEHWASGYINLASRENLIKGDGTYFYPDRKINTAELITMFLRVIGVGEYLDKLNNYPSVQLNFAFGEKILTNLVKDINTPLTRYEACLLMNELIESNIWRNSYQKGLEKLEDTVMSKYMGFTIIREAILDFYDGYTADVITRDDDDEYTVIQRSLVVKSNKDILNVEEGYLVDVWLRNKVIIKMETSRESSYETVDFGSVVNYDEDKSKITIKTNAKQYSYILNKDILRVDINGESMDVFNKSFNSVERFLVRNIDYNSSSGRLILDDSKKVISIKMMSYDSILVVDYVRDHYIYNKDSVKRYSDINLKNKSYLIRDTEGNVMNIDELKSNDILLYSLNGSKYSMILLRDNKITGKVTYVDDEYLKLDGKKYYFNFQFFSSIPTEDKKVTIYLDQSDNILIWSY